MTALVRGEAIVVPVSLGPRSYEIAIGHGILAALGTRVAALRPGAKTFVVSDENVARYVLTTAETALQRAGVPTGRMIVPAGEASKNYRVLEQLCEAILEAQIERSDLIVALGGGVIGDLAGFAAAVVRRGLDYVQVPTSLLAQVDSSVGGKTAIDSRHGKNLIGAFHQPRLVLADVETLETLPRRELLAGLAEVIKYGAIGDAALFARLEEGVGELIELRSEVLVPVVTACARQKAAVVAQDEREERGGRAVLNFGHTVGHAIETLTGYKELLHGEAVAIGMVAAARVSQSLGRCGSEPVERLVRLLKRAGLPTDIPRGLAPAALALAMRADKKSAGGRLRFVCLEAIGRTAFVELTAEEIANRL